MKGEQRRPDSGDALSRDERFHAWLAMSDHLVDDYFVVFDVEGMPDNPYSVAGLRVAEAELLRRFASVDEALEPENRGLFDKFVRFLGAAFVNGLGFEWTSKPIDNDNGIAYIAVENFAIETQLNVPGLVTAAAHRRSGEEWTFVYRNMHKRLSGKAG